MAVVLPFEVEITLELVILGVITGLTYSLLGMGLALLYRSTRIINFAHGTVGVLASGVLLVLTEIHHIPYLFALGAALAVGATTGALIEFLLIRRLANASRLVLMVATIGVSQLLLGVDLLIPRDDFVRGYPVPFDAKLTVGNLRLGPGHLMILVIAPVITLGLTLLLRRSRLGFGMRASAENPEAARLAGMPARRISVAIWVTAALLSTVSAVLVGPLQGVGGSQTLGPSLMVKALAAAAIGGFSSLPLVFGGGITIGLLEVVLSWNYPNAGLLNIILLAVIITALIVRTSLGAAATRGAAAAWSLGGTFPVLEQRLASRAPVRILNGAIVAIAIAIATWAPLSVDSGKRVLFSSIVLFALMGLSLVVLSGYAGQISLGQFAFVAIAAAAGGRIQQLGHGAVLQILGAIAAGATVALVVGLPSLRLRGLFLAVSTFAFALAGESWIVRQDWLVRVEGGLSSLTLDRPEWFGIDFQNELHYYWLCLGVLVLIGFLVANLRRTGVGRMMMAVRDNEPAASALTISPGRTKLLAFVLSGAIAAIGGYFYGLLLVNFTQASLFDAANSLPLVTMVIFGGVTTVTGAVLGALWIRGIPYFFGSDFGILSSGIGVVVILQMLPGGLATLAFQVRNRIAAMLVGSQPAEPTDSHQPLGMSRDVLPPAEAHEVGDELPLSADGIVVSFGGLRAIDLVSIEARESEMVGLLGPNGAGKTTLFDVLAGHIRPGAGTVSLYGRDISGRTPEARARMGLGRSFQDAKLFPDLSLRDTFKLALERNARSPMISSVLSLPPSWMAERRKSLRANELIDLLGLGPYADRNCAELSTGTRRFVELGCLLAMGCRVLLLDEPTAGIAQREVEAFVPVLKEIRDHLGATIIVIDHDIPMMMELVDRMYVMVAGSVIAEGDPTLLRDDPAVIASYLGTDERAILRSGH